MEVGELAVAAAEVRDAVAFVDIAA